MTQLEVSRRFATSPERVWARYTDHASWTEWAGVGRAIVTRSGMPPPNGVGAVRRVGPPPLAVDEEIVAFEAPRRLAYRVVRGAVPFRDHLGEVFLHADGDGTRVVWRVRFNPIVPGTGWAIRGVLGGILGRVLRNLAADLGA